MDRTLRDADLQAQLLELARQVIGGEYDQPLVVIIMAGGEVAVMRPGPPPELPPGLRDYDRTILEALTERPASAQQLARRSGHRFNSYFRQRLAILKDAGCLRHTRRGYTRPL
jgi:hypothetical protein